MGANSKFDRQSSVNHLRHILREVEKPKNVDIDKNRVHLNYSLTPKRKMKPYTYLQKRLKELHVSEKRNLKVMSGWVITKPQDLEESQEKEFFKAVNDFLTERYGGEKNVISSEVHKDESGEPHIHFYFIPVTKYIPNKNLLKVIEYFKKEENKNKNNTVAGKELGIDRKTVRRYRNKTEKDVHYEKVSAREVINKKELITIHSDMQSYLDELGIDAKVHTGVTKKKGGNMTVAQLKQQREYLLQHGENVENIIDNIQIAIDEKENKIKF